MKLATVAAALTSRVLALDCAGRGEGCLKGALVGGVAGHYAGHHGVMGAIGGAPSSITWLTKRRSSRRLRARRALNHPTERGGPRSFSPRPLGQAEARGRDHLFDVDSRQPLAAHGLRRAARGQTGGGVRRER